LFICVFIYFNVVRVWVLELWEDQEHPKRVSGCIRFKSVILLCTYYSYHVS
jgi:hypothetical protein